MSDVAPSLDELGLAPRALDVLTRSHAERVAATLDLDGLVAADPLGEGILPLPWLWTYFTPTAPTNGLRSDGHPAPAQGGALAGLERRMFIGGSMERHRDLLLDEATERVSRVAGAERKKGSTGEFLLVNVENRYRQRGADVVVERQRVMYRAQPSVAVEAPGPAVDAPTSHGPRGELRPDERLLFRYSALTFNTHRIHYDLPYTREVEGYPGLVVHGPLTATVLVHLAEEAFSAPASAFEFRATAPTFAGTIVHFVVDEAVDGEPLGVRAVREDGVTVMTARAQG